MVVPAAAASSKFACARKPCRWHSSIILAQVGLGRHFFHLFTNNKRVKNLFFILIAFPRESHHFCFSAHPPNSPLTSKICIYTTSRCQAPSFHVIVLPVTFSVGSSSNISLLCRKAIAECAWQCHTVRVQQSLTAAAAASVISSSNTLCLVLLARSLLTVYLVLPRQPRAIQRMQSGVCACCCLSCTFCAAVLHRQAPAECARGCCNCLRSSSLNFWCYLS
jgi:hypothetical protein